MKLTRLIEAQYVGKTIKGKPIIIPFPLRTVKWTVHQLVEDLNEMTEYSEEFDELRIEPQHITPDVVKFANKKFAKLRKYINNESTHMDEFASALEDIIKYVVKNA